LTAGVGEQRQVGGDGRRAELAEAVGQGVAEREVGGRFCRLRLAEMGGVEMAGGAVEHQALTLLVGAVAGGAVVGLLESGQLDHGVDRSPMPQKVEI
jgi:hypothetical protein